MRPFDWAPGVTARPIFLIVAMIFVRLVFYIYICFFFCFCFFNCILLTFIRLIHEPQARIHRATWSHALTLILIHRTCIIRIARKRLDIYYLINEVFMQRPLRRLRNLIWLLFLYILFVLVKMKQSISFLTKST